MHIHLARKRDQSKMDNHSSFISIFESGSTKCYFYKARLFPLCVFTSFQLINFPQEWSRLGNQIIRIIEQLTQAEKDAFATLRKMVSS